MVLLQGAISLAANVTRANIRANVRVHVGPPIRSKQALISLVSTQVSSKLVSMEKMHQLRA